MLSSLLPEIAMEFNTIDEAWMFWIRYGGQKGFEVGKRYRNERKSDGNLSRAYHKNKMPALLFKLDIAKAFDSVSWEYLLELLEKRGFSVRWRNWIFLILASSSSSVMLNGVPGPFFHHERGLRQGDPLSPYLFILAIDTLHRLFVLATEEGELTELRGRHASIRLSLYADDAALFLNPRKEEVDTTLKILEHFGEATGLKVNLTKSLVAAIRCTELDLQSILSNFS